MAKAEADDELYVCGNCVPDKNLRAALTDDAAIIRCKYCRKSSTGCTVDDLTEAMRKRIELCTHRGEYVRAPSGYPLSEQQGDSLDSILQDRFGFGDEIAADISRMLVDNDVAENSGDESYFIDGENYVWDNPYLQSDYSGVWTWFEERIKHTNRFFDSRCLTYLERIFGAAGSPEADEIPSYLLNPENPESCVFRARRAKSHADIERFCENAATELGAPPPALATAGRMNPQGISVFYGALSKDVAVSEVRPSVGSIVVVGKFIPERTLRLLDMPNLANSHRPPPGSIFAPDYDDLMTRQRLLEGFHSQITRPIQPHDEALDYVPTQVVAQYVANVLKFDGILYASAQDGDDSPASREAKLNVVIFQESVWSQTPPPTSLRLEADSVEAVTITAINYSTAIESLSTKFPYGWKYEPADELDRNRLERNVDEVIND